MPTKQEIKEELARYGCKPDGATCAHKVQVGDPRSKEGKPFPGIVLCGRYYDNDGNLRDVPNIDPSYVHQPHHDHLFGLPAFGGGSGHGAVVHPSSIEPGARPIWPRPLDRSPGSPNG